jgi:Zn-dependent protease with chaperone function
MRDRDLRAVGAGDLFHFLPAHEPHQPHRLFATHPPLRRRLAELDRMERELQG